MDSNELKPCPFCGEEDLEGPHSTDYIGDTYAPEWWIECKKCPCILTVEGKTKEGVIRAWNTRPTDELIKES